MSAASLFGPALIEAIKQHSIAHVDQLYADAGITEGMSSDEVDRRISAEYRRRERKAERVEAAAAFWRAVQRGREDW